MSPSKIGKCLLCMCMAELSESHFVPKALYRLVRAGSKGALPLQITVEGRQQTSKQAVQHLLCADCERRFDRNGENWMMRHCYRGRGVFRFRDLLKESTCIHAGADIQIYSGSATENVSVGSIVYFSTSVFWRASIADWWSSGRKYERISLGDRYQEEIRQYLLGQADFPQNAAVMVILSSLTQPVLAFNFPLSIRVDLCHSHRFHIPGITFLLIVGRNAPDLFGETCILRSPLHPIFVSKTGDERVQREMMRLMGKVAPDGYEYPLIEGVERA